MITSEIPAYTHYCRAADAYGVLLMDVCDTCGGITAGPTRFVIPRDRMHERAEKRLEKKPEHRCRCLDGAAEGEK